MLGKPEFVVLVGYEGDSTTFVAHLARGNNHGERIFEALKAVVKEQTAAGQLRRGGFDFGEFNGLGFRIGQVASHELLRGRTKPQEQVGPLADWLANLLQQKLHGKS